MAVSGLDLLEAPVGTGVLQRDLFPDKTNLGALSVVLDDFVRVGYLRASGLASSDAQDAAARAYANWQSYERRIEQLAGHTAGQVSLVGQFSVGTTGEQLQQLARKALYWQGEFERYVPAIEQSGSASLPTPSRTTTISTSW